MFIFPPENGRAVKQSMEVTRENYSTSEIYINDYEYRRIYVMMLFLPFLVVNLYESVTLQNYF
jgi:hypothetical protein